MKRNLFFFIFLFFWFYLKSQHLDSLLIKINKSYYEKGDYINAIPKYLSILDAAERIKDTDVIIKCNFRIGFSNYYLQNSEEALKWFYESYNNVKKFNRKEFLPIAYYYIGIIYIENENEDSSTKYIHKAIPLFHIQKNYDYLSLCNSVLAELYINLSILNKNDIYGNKIHYYIENAEKYAKLINDTLRISFAIAKKYNYAFYIKKNYSKAINYANQIEKLLKNSKNLEYKINNYRQKAECLIMLKDTSAYKYMYLWMNYKDSVLKKEKISHLAAYEARYYTKKKELENRLLHQKNKTNESEIKAKNRLILILIVLGITVILIILIFFIRTSLKKKELQLSIIQKIQEDKERIARDLHDNVGGQLSYIFYTLDSIKNCDKTKKEIIIENLKKSVKLVISSLRDTIWAVSDADISIFDISDKLKVFSKNLFHHTNTNVHFTEEIKEEVKLNSLIGLNIYRICQEILFNAFKYAKASDVMIDFRSNKNELEICITDNGIGFDKNNTTNGYGLNNIQKRSDDYHIHIEFISELNKGTFYRIHYTIK